VSSDKLIAVTPDDSVSLPASATEDTSKLLLVNNDLTPAVLSTDAVEVELTNDLTALTTGPVTVMGAVTEISTELAAGADDLATVVLSSAIQGSGVSILGLRENISDTTVKMLLSVSLSPHGTSEEDD